MGECCTQFTQLPKIHANIAAKINQLSKLVIVLKKNKNKSEILEEKRKKSMKQQSSSPPFPN